MTKTKKLLAIVGGALALIVVVAAYLAYRAYGEKVVALEGDYEEGTDGLENCLVKAEQLSKKSIYPTSGNVKALKTAASTFATWRDEAERLVAAGDRKLEPTTPAAFKEFLRRDAKRIDAEFEYGPFKDYINGGAMPVEAELGTLQRQWDDVATVADALKGAGVEKFVSLAIVKDETAAKPATTPKNRKPARKNAKAAEKPTAVPKAMRYELSFIARPAALVKALNALTVADRFVVVESLNFQHDQDSLATAIAGEKKAEAKSSRRARRGLEATAESEKPAGNVKVADPVTDPPFTVNLKFAVYDFNSLEEDAK